MTTNEMTPADLAVCCGNNNDGFGGNNGWWILLLFLFGMNGGWGNGWGFGGNGGGFVGADVQRGFDQAAVISGINTLNSNVTNGFAQAEISANARQIADMNQNFASQTALTNNLFGIQSGLQNCCCENRSAVQDLKYTVATENCADRAALSDGIRDVIENNTRNTQAILDKLCAQELDAERRENANLRTQLNMANLAASQTAQTSRLLADNAAQTVAIENYLAPKAPVAAYVVPNPNGCPTNYGCGCGCGSF